MLALLQEAVVITLGTASGRFSGVKLLSGLAALAGIGMMSPSLAQAQGRIAFEGKLASPLLGGHRVIHIRVPASYDTDTSRRYPVLYVHDGQNAFTTAGTNVAFGWGNWELDRTVDQLERQRRMREIIVVAVDATVQRYAEYRGPARPYTAEQLARLKRRPPAPGDDGPFRTYARFLIEELKPKIDREYRTLSGASDTGLLGSSLGGICSLALAWDHPDRFGLVASLSGAFQVEDRYLLEAILRVYQGPPKPLRIYLDSGVIDFTGSDDGRKDTEAVAERLRRIGWRDAVDLVHFVDALTIREADLPGTGLRRDKWEETQTSQHNEFYWRLRVWRPLVFLFPPEAATEKP